MKHKNWEEEQSSWKEYNHEDPDPYDAKRDAKVSFRVWDSKLRFFWRLYYWGTPFL